LLIFFLGTLRATLFWLLQLPQVAGWLWNKPQAEHRQHRKSLLLSADPPSPLLEMAIKRFLQYFPIFYSISPFFT
jgi:hypothetical protein